LIAANCLQSILEELNSTVSTDLQIEWVTQSLTASSEVIGDDGNNYRCILPHTSATATNKPITGSEWEKYWVLGDSSGVAWVDSTDYTSIGVFSPDSDTLDILAMYMQDGADTYSPMTPLSDISFHGGVQDKSDMGMPEAFFFDVPNTRVFLVYQPDSARYLVHYLRVKAIASMDDADSTVALDKGWYRPLIYKLAADVMDYNPAALLPNKQYITAKAEIAFKNAKKRSFYRSATTEN
jgi:hypothetical protein